VAYAARVEARNRVAIKDSMVNVKVDYKFVGDIGVFKQQVELHKLWLGSIYSLGWEVSTSRLKVMSISIARDFANRFGWLRPDTDVQVVFRYTVEPSTFVLLCKRDL